MANAGAEYTVDSGCLVGFFGVVLYAMGPGEIVGSPMPPFVLRDAMEYAGAEARVDTGCFPIPAAMV